MKKFSVFSVIMAVLVMTAGFVALSPTSASGAGNPVNLVAFTAPDIRISPQVEVALTEEYSWDNFRVYKFALKNNDTERRFLSTVFSTKRAGDYRWWAVFFSSKGKGEEIKRSSWQFPLDPGEEYVLFLVFKTLDVNRRDPLALVTPTIWEMPKLHDIVFRMENGVVHTTWRSTGNVQGEPVRVIINSLHDDSRSFFADIPDTGEAGHAWHVESYPRGEYYLTILFLSSSGIQEIHSPLYYSPGPFVP